MRDYSNILSEIFLFFPILIVSICNAWTGIALAEQWNESPKESVFQSDA